VRELLNTIERAVLLCDGKIILPRHLLLPAAISKSIPENVRLAGLSGPLDDTEPSAFGIYSRLPSEAPTPAPGMQSATAQSRSMLDTFEKDHFHLETMERKIIQKALEYAHWNQVQASELLGIHRNTLRKKIAEYGLHPPENSDNAD
jgi:DNA-binding NtrC family response regulator